MLSALRVVAVECSCAEQSLRLLQLPQVRWKSISSRPHWQVVCLAPMLSLRASVHVPAQAAAGELRVLHGVLDGGVSLGAVVGQGCRCRAHILCRGNVVLLAAKVVGVGVSPVYQSAQWGRLPARPQ
eukprot:309441-Pyramimonas_sp.AAC.1